MRRVSGYRTEDDGKMIACCFDFEHGAEEFEVTNMFDIDGEETNDPDETVVIVVKISEHEWHTVDIRNYIKLVAN